MPAKNPSLIRTLALEVAPMLMLAGAGLALRREGRSEDGSSPTRPSKPLRPEARASDNAPAQAAQVERGRQADTPREIPPKGWKDILLRTWKEFREDQIPLISAGITFYTMLAIFPAMGAFVALYGLVADVNDVQRQLHSLTLVMTPEMAAFLGDQMTRIAQAQHGGLSFAFLVGLATSLWSANGAIKALFTGLNIAYEEQEHRNFFKLTLTTLAITAGGLLLGVGMIAATLAGPVLGRLMGATAETLFTWATWAAMLLAMAMGLALLYRYGPCRRKPKWRWITPGSAIATLLWLGATAAFSFYVNHFGNYNKTYGSLGAAIGFMTWIWLSTLVVLAGAELNSEIEHQTARDSTIGPEKPMGRRNATMADTIGPAQGR